MAVLSFSVSQEIAATQKKGLGFVCGGYKVLNEITADQVVTNPIHKIHTFEQGI